MGSSPSASLDLVRNLAHISSLRTAAVTGTAAVIQTAGWGPSGTLSTRHGQESVYDKRRRWAVNGHSPRRTSALPPGRRRLGRSVHLALDHTGLTEIQPADFRFSLENQGIEHQKPVSTERWGGGHPSRLRVLLQGPDGDLALGLDHRAVSTPGIVTASANLMAISFRGGLPRSTAPANQASTSSAPASVML